MIPLILPAGAALAKLAGGIGAAGALGAAGAYGISRIGPSIEEDILKSAPNDPDDPAGLKYKTNPIQDFFINEQELGNKFYKRQRNDLYKNDAKVRERLTQLGLTKEALGQRSSDVFLADTKKESKRLDDIEDLKNQIEGMDGGAAKLASLPDNPTKAMLKKAVISLDKVDRYGGGRGTLIAAEKDRDFLRRQEASRYTDRLEGLLADRQFQQSQAQNNYQLQLGQMNMNNRRLDMENARSNRRDQREALALLLQGLGNVTNNLVEY